MDRLSLFYEGVEENRFGVENMHFSEVASREATPFVTDPIAPGDDGPTALAITSVGLGMRDTYDMD